MFRTAPSVPTRFIIVLGLFCFLISSGFLFLIYGFTSYEQVQSLSKVTYHEGGYKHLALAVTPASYQLLQIGLAAIAGLSGSLLMALRYFQKASIQAEIRLLQIEIRRASVALGSTVRGLSRLERGVFAGLLVLILAVRVWYLVAYVLNTDEVASYDYFVRQGPLGISSFYPIPNNHLLFNFICWPLSLVSDNVRVVMRVPTFVAAAVGTILGHLLLARRGGFWAATLATGLFSLSPLGLYYAVAGRGYFLQITLLLLAFSATVALLQSPMYRRVGWLLFVGASILGFYTIPTFLYPFVSLSLGLLIGFVWQRRWLELGQLVLAGGIVGAVSALLYWPVMCVSGFTQLVGNHYVAKMAATVFWRNYLGYLRNLADMLAGNGHLGMVAGGGLMMLGPFLIRLLPRRAKVISALAWLLLVVPLALMAVQQVLIPARVLLYLSYSGCVLGSLIGITLLSRLRVPTTYQALLCLAIVVAYGSYQFERQLAPHQVEVREEEQMEAAYTWLTSWGGQRVLLTAPSYELFFYHYALQEHRPLLLHSSSVPNQTYDYVVQARSSDPLPLWVKPPLYTLVYENESVVIYGRTPKQ
ncbi:hypothetical protein [Hymenobacter volaticus]|uniref:Glycosyltransferase RgtA/B/C/D-like domain-containing protein n=1 Tax=Hymenobacter volaticus TaxID=2932254 RepID=A0ABY4G0A7_9BACT|nr:hypothetical protein [Hymenobacter volaticus]UOQ64302.1 hypothetical protein MUN86_11905 [Hymenobacter volaticus]